MGEDFKLALELVTPAFQQRQLELTEQAAERRLKAIKVRRFLLFSQNSL